MILTEIDAKYDSMSVLNTFFKKQLTYLTKPSQFYFLWRLSLAEGNFLQRTHLLSYKIDEQGRSEVSLSLVRIPVIASKLSCLSFLVFRWTSLAYW